MSREFRYWWNNKIIEYILITTGFPRSNVQVKRINRIVIPLFTKLSTPHSENWYKHVERVQQFIKVTSARSTGLSSFELLIGHSMHLRPYLRDWWFSSCWTRNLSVAMFRSQFLNDGYWYKMWANPKGHMKLWITSENRRFIKIWVL